MVYKKIIVTSFVLFTTPLILSTALLAQTTEQLEIIDENSVVLSCIQGNEFDAMNEQEQNKVELPICEEHVTTEELAAEMNGEIALTDPVMNDQQCVSIVDYEAMTDDERAAIEIPVCEDIELTTEELALELNGEVTFIDPAKNDEECLSIVDYDVMTDDERAALEIPICDDEYSEKIGDPIKTQ